MIILRFMIRIGRQRGMERCKNSLSTRIIEISYNFQEQSCLFQGFHFFFEFFNRNSLAIFYRFLPLSNFLLNCYAHFITAWNLSQKAVLCCELLRVWDESFWK